MGFVDLSDVPTTADITYGGLDEIVSGQLRGGMAYAALDLCGPTINKMATAKGLPPRGTMFHAVCNFWRCQP